MRIRRPKASRADVHPQVHPHAAGFDSGSDEIGVGVPEDRAAEPVRPCGPVTPARDALADWRATCRMATVALASTGVYGMPVDERLEARGVQVHLVNARHLQQVPGRKPDVQACQGIPDVHPCGLLSGACRPAAERCAWRASWRQRATWLADRAAQLQHLQQALPQLHVQLPHVRTESTGTTGLAILRASVAGARDPVHLAPVREPRGAHRPAEIAQALTGHDRADPVLALQPARARDDV